jgi:NADH-quinone oxidoreductase subunit D
MHTSIPWIIGPYHAWLPGPMRFFLTLKGDLVTSCKVETGYLHRDIENCLQRKPWIALQSCVDHLDPENAFFSELAISLAIESLAEISVSQRAQAIRVVLCELSRIATHLLYIAKIGQTVGLNTLQNYVLRDRESILELFELITGSRFSFNFFQIGGVKADLTDGFMERILEFCELMSSRIKEYNDLLTYHVIFLSRSVQIGVITPKTVHTFGITGPNARASGVDLDLRKVAPYSGYEQYDFLPIPEEFQKSDVHSRFILRLHEINESMHILKQIIQRFPIGGYQNEAIELEPSMTLPAGEAYARVQSSRGLLSCHLISTGKTTPTRIAFRTPSYLHLCAIPKIVHHLSVDDFWITIKSLDLSLGEADR